MNDDRRDDDRAEGVRNSGGNVYDHGAMLQGRSFENVNIYQGTFSTRRVFGLPAPPRFVNREVEKARMREVIEGGRHHATLLPVSAPTGGGASALVSKVLYECFERDPERFPGGRFLVESARYGTLDAVRRLLADMGFEEKDIPVVQERRREVLHRELARRGAVAVVVERPLAADDVLPFVATTPGSITVVASSTELDLFQDHGPDSDVLDRVEEADPIVLEPLDEECAAALLCLCAGVTPVSPEQQVMVSQLVALSQGSPRTLRHYGRRVARKRAREADPFEAAYRALCGSDDAYVVAAGALRGPAAVNGGVAGEVRRLLQAEGLSPEACGLAVRLAVHPDVPFGVGIAARLAGTAEAGPLLAELVGEEALSAVAGEDGERYEFPDKPLRRELAELANDDGAVFREILTHYFEHASAAHLVLLPDRWRQADLDGRSAFPGGSTAEVRFNSAARAREWLDHERATLRLTAMHAVVREEFAMAAELCETLWAYWFTAGYFTDVVDTHTQLLRDTLGTHRLDPARLSRLCVQRSIAYRRDRALDLAERDAWRALNQAEDAHPLVRLTAVESVGDVERENGALGTAAERFAQAADIAETLDPFDPRAVVITIRKLAGVRLDQGAPETAERLVLRVLALLREKVPDDVHNLARAEAVLGDVYAVQGRLGKALGCWAEAIGLHERLGDHRRAADMHVRRANAVEPTDGAAARAELERALARYREAGAHLDAREVAARLDAWS